MIQDLVISIVFTSRMWLTNLSFSRSFQITFDSLPGIH